MALIPSLSNNDFRFICLQIVKDFPFAEGKQVNTFSTVDVKGRPIAGSEMAKTYNHYERGYFWAREWVAMGADVDRMGKKEFPICAYEVKEREIREIGKGDGCDTIYLTIFDQFDCETCQRTEEEVSRDTRVMLYAFIEELYTYGVYEVDGAFLWMSAGRYKHLSGKGELPKDLEPDRMMDDFIPSKGVKMREWGGFSDDVVGWSVMFNICYCDKSGIEFNYQHEIPEPVEKSNCHGCI